ncbi:hypothetical protein B0H21DRAFT_875815 [Amylocystis lapponica]|nr:hypothetical protein B0H21DRAFT_875815 [Amylocystis lapponica]
MHRALDNFDILSEVFEHLPVYPSYWLDPLNRRTLSQAARVCRAFSDPALGVLWRTLLNPLPLFRLFTSLQKIQHDGGYWTDRNMPQYDLARFQQYARRIRAIRVRRASPQVETSVYFQVAHHLKGEFLLPCLTTLRWEQLSPYDTSITTLLSPSLHSINLNFDKPVDVVSAQNNPNSGRHITLGMLLQSIFQACPSLKDISMTNLYVPPESFAFTALQRLCKVELHDCSPLITSHVLQALSTVPTLVHLVLDIPVEDDKDDSGLRSCCNGFYALRTLAISGRLSHIQPIVSAISSTAVDSLDINIKSKDGATKHASLLTIVASRWSTSLHTLKLKLRLSLECKPSDGPQHNVALMQFLHPALALGALTSLKIWAWDVPLAISDEDTRELASSYPCIEALRILNDPAPRLPPQTTLRDYVRGSPPLSALLDLAHRLPALRDLTMPFRLDQLQLETLVANPRVASSALLNLGAWQSILEVAPKDPRRVANCIIAAFPNLATLRFPEAILLFEEEWACVSETSIAALGKTMEVLVKSMYRTERRCILLVRTW